MATLVLTAVGTLVGGPVGGAIGALLGQQVDSRLFARSTRGPRLGDLAVQTSAYGSAIPKLFGSLRVAGTVIWATDIREDKHKSGGGKGKPKGTTYSYSVSFAVALSGRRIRGVGRIWADGKLLRGAGGDFQSETGFRLHIGDEAQAVDPLIASAEGAGAAPAYRGTAYAVFEEFQLGDYGNHIPSLTFEVFADDAPVSVAAIAGELAGDAVAASGTTAPAGFAATGDSIRATIEALGVLAPLTAGDDGVRLVLREGPGDDIAIVQEALGARADDRRGERREVERRASAVLSDEVSVTYYEPSRDYQAGLQRARRGGPGRRIERIELPAALSADAAKAVAERRLSKAWAERSTATVKLGWGSLALRPGDIAALPDDATRWRVSGWRFEQMVVELMLTAASVASVASGPAAAGRVTADPDRPQGPTILQLMDLPALGDELPAVPRLWLAAAGTMPGWRRAAVVASFDDGASWQNLGATAAPAVIGSAASVLDDRGGALFDAVSAVEVVLAHDEMLLDSCDDAALVAGQNLAAIGDELVQFGAATRIAPARWRLARLLRGRRGSEWATAGHATAERFVLLDPATLLAIDPPVSALGAQARVIASGVGDAPAGAAASATVIGRALRPPAPVAITATVAGDGALTIGWTRRSRAGWRWIDGGDAPLGEEAERYRLTITPDAGHARSVETTAPGYVWTAAARASAGAGAASVVSLSIVQLGTAAASLPAGSSSFTL